MRKPVLSSTFFSLLNCVVVMAGSFWNTWTIERIQCMCKDRNLKGSPNSRNIFPHPFWDPKTGTSNVLGLIMALLVVGIEEQIVK